MTQIIGIRSETKNTWERRVPMTPELVRRLVNQHGLQIQVQPSARRVFPDKEFVRAGAEMKMELSEAGIIFGVKEVPPDLLQAETAYMFFSHVIKGQSYNMPMLKKILELGCTLIDYEKVRDDEGRRLIFFGHFAGLAGMIDALWTLGQRYQSRGIRTPFLHLEPAHRYESLDDAKQAVRKVGAEISEQGLPSEITPLIIGIAGYGNVAGGAREILAELPHQEIAPSELESAQPENSRLVYGCTFKEQDLVAKRKGEFDLQDYYAHPENYESIAEEKLEKLSLLINANYWDERYPRLVRSEWLRKLYSQSTEPRLQVIGDLGCDIGGNVECTLKCTDPGDPVFTWIPESNEIVSGVDAHGPAILAVDILPTELPRESSQEFASALESFVPAIAAADFTSSFEDLELPAPIKRAVIVHRGELTPEFEYLREYLPR